MSDEKLQVLLFGLGAIGSFYAFILGRDEKVSLSVVARSNYDIVKDNGLTIQSANHGEHKVNIENVYKTPSEAGRRFDFIVCTNKAINIESVLPLFRTVVDEHTTFALIQNGVGNEDPFRKEYPKCTIISCVTWVGAYQLSPGVAVHIPSENTMMGLFPNPEVDESVEKRRLDQFAAILQVGGTKFSIEQNIQIQRWEKVVWNAAWNSLTALTMISTHSWLDSSPEATTMTQRLMREVIEVGKACGVPLDDDLVDRHFEAILALPPVYTSMYMDVKEGRPTEVEVILGTPAKKAKEFNIDTPILTMLYALIGAIDERIRKGKSEDPVA